MDQPRISIVIPTYGRPRYLDHAIRSALAQTLPPAEIIVVDDCSPIPVELADSLQDRVLMVRHLRNQGPGATRNTGAALASGDWLLFLDDDDLLTPRRLEWAAKDMGQARMHACRMERFREDGTITELNPRVYSGDMQQVLPRGNFPSLGQVVLRREDILQFNPDWRVSEDSEWWLRMADRAHFAWTDEVGLRVRQHSEARPGVHSQSHLLTRRQIATRYAPSADRATRARLFSNVAAAALLADHPFRAIAWSLRSLASQPSLIALKLIGRAVLGTRFLSSTSTPDR